MSDKFLIVGLGNPGLDYEKTKHNVGFMCVDKILEDKQIFLNNNKFNGQYTIFNNSKGDQIFLSKPLTYMNNSGQFVYEITKFYKIDVNNILVIYDDIDTEIGKIRVKAKGSSGGQNGIKSIINSLHTENIKRVRIGIGKPTDDLSHYVLTKFNGQDLDKVSSAINKAKLACLDFLECTDFNIIMNKFNG